MKELCPIGQRLRYLANFQATCIRSSAWLREGITPGERSTMLEDARQADGDTFAIAYEEWRQHRHNCKTCQEALSV